MKTRSLWIIRVALTVQFMGVLAVPALLAAAESPRAMWMAEWLNPAHHESNARAIGILKLRDGKLMFNEQVDQEKWEIELASVKRVGVAGGRALKIETVGGETYVVAIMDANLTIGSPKKVIVMIDRVLQTTLTERLALSESRRERQ